MENTNVSEKKVLVVEDEKVMARAMQLKLEKDGIHAVVANNGEECLAELQKDTYDLILLDIMMPGMDGWTVMSEMKKKGINTKVIVTSNLSQTEDKKRAHSMGAISFLVKSDATLLSIVEEVKKYL